MIRIADIKQVEQAALDLLAAARNANTRTARGRVRPDDEQALLQSVHLALIVLNELADHDRQVLPGVLCGLEEIGLFLGRGKVAVKRLIQNEGLPVSIEGKKYLATKSALIQWQTDRSGSRFGMKTARKPL